MPFALHDAADRFAEFPDVGSSRVKSCRIGVAPILRLLTVAVLKAAGSDALSAYLPGIMANAYRPAPSVTVINFTPVL
jgi:hypothetical protein